MKCPEITRGPEVLRSGGRAALEDLAGKNGAYLGGTRRQGSAVLTDGDEILLGSALVIFLASGGGSTRTDRASRRGRMDGGPRAIR